MFKWLLLRISLMIYLHYDDMQALTVNIQLFAKIIN